MLDIGPLPLVAVAGRRHLAGIADAVIIAIPDIADASDPAGVSVVTGIAGVAGILGFRRVGEFKQGVEIQVPAILEQENDAVLPF
ncbi:MAG: hypothetical protein LIP77_09305, partial [Planctomycetes bacterium]|nr:hypothetical protein [Planctomycetota bacterium]